MKIIIKAEDPKEISIEDFNRIVNLINELTDKYECKAEFIDFHVNGKFIENEEEIIIQTESGKIVSDKDWDSYLGISHLFAEKYGIFLNAHENIKFLRK